MLDRLALRVENSRLQVYVNFGFHLATCSELIKHCLKSSYWNNISRSKKRPEEKLIMQNPPPVQTAKSSTGLDENLAALLSYIFGWLSGLIFFPDREGKSPGSVSRDAVVVIERCGISDRHRALVFIDSFVGYRKPDFRNPEFSDQRDRRPRSVCAFRRHSGRRDHVLD